MRIILLFTMLTFLHTRSVAQDDYKQVSKEVFDNDIQTFENMTNTQNLFILGPGENAVIPNGTVITVNVTFTKVTAAVLEAWKLTGPFGKTSYFTRNFLSDRTTPENYSKNFVVSSLQDCITSFPVKVNSPIVLQKEPMPGYSTGQSTLYLSPLSWEFDLEVIASGYDPIKIHKSPDEIDFEVHLAPQIKNVNLSGNVNVNNQNNTSNSKNSLDIYSAKQIADILGLNEKDIIDLITSKKLQGKIIAGKYYVRKEDLDAFMKK